MRVGLIGDYQASVPAHNAIPKALDLASEKISVSVEFTWLETNRLELTSLSTFDALWCVPASPIKFHSSELVGDISTRL